MGNGGGSGMEAWRGARLLARLGWLAACVAVTMAVWPHAQTPRKPRAPRIVWVNDETGRVVPVPQPVRRIVSLAPNLTETLFALGLGDRVVGVTDYCDYPPEATTREHVGGPITPNLERIAELRPDLVLATRTGGNRLATVQSLETLGIAVYATDPRTVEQVIHSTEQLAQLISGADPGRTLAPDRIGAGPVASGLASSLRRRLSAVAERLSGSRPIPVLLVVWPEPLISVGRNTFIADALRRAGAENVIRTAQDWPNASLEEVARQQPEYLIFWSDQSVQTERQIAELRGLPGWRRLEALRRNRIIVLSEAMARPAPRLVDVIEQLAQALHPERFSRDVTRRPSAAAPAALPAYGGPTDGTR